MIFLIKIIYRIRTILHIVKNFETRYTADMPKSGRPRNARSREQFATVRDSVAENLETSIRRRALERIYNAAKDGHLADISWIP